jgi:DNA mismatch repair protein MutL
MAKIQILDALVADQIAAGEVVERPSSVVKELAENSLDAHALNVEVETLEAGKRVILVSDDGDGMDKDDLQQSVLRHATSKIRSAEDLWDLQSFGFRGEALPSIASVSRLSVISRAKDSLNAWKLSMEGGQNRALEPSGLGMGTRIEARDLFFNTPARLKFLKAPSTEDARVVSALQGLAFCHPQSGFKLRQDKRETLSWKGVDTLEERVSQILGGSFLDEALHLDMDSSAAQVRGWVGRPHAHRGTRSQQWLFVQGRCVEHRLFNFTLSQAFGSLIPPGRYASAVVYLTLPKGSLDVNVHPAKREVRFVRESDVLSALRHAVQKSLNAANLSVPVSINLANPGPQHFQSPQAYPHNDYASVPRLFDSHAESGQSTLAPHQQASGWMPEPAEAQGHHQSTDHSKHPVALCQLHRSYIVCQSAEGLVLVDQHAGHERVLYERMLKRLQQGSLARQALLLPQKLSLGPAQAARLKAWNQTLDLMGVEITDLGGNDFYITHLPSLPRQWSMAPLLQDLLDTADEEKAADPGEWLKQELAASLACKAAIKAGDPLTLEEMRSLIIELFQCEIPWSCPHGRPPFVSLSLAELEKYFQRR